MKHTPITPSVADAILALEVGAETLRERAASSLIERDALDAKWSARSRVYHDRQENGRG